MKQFLCLLLFPVLWGAADPELEAILANRIDTAKKAVGIVVGMINEKGVQITSHGKFVAGSNQNLDGDTLFEIGSITKVFTSLLLAGMIERGEVKADDPVRKYLPSSVKIPSRNGREITLLDLSMQVSGLPPMPNNMKPADPENPYADYTVEQMYAFLSGHELRRDPGEKYEYSNLAVGLLGHTLALKSGMSYERLVRARILEPLKMTSTFITVPDAEKSRFAPGNKPNLQPAKHWALPTFAGAVALRSTANDMLRFLAANLELTDTPLKLGMRRMRALSKPTGSPDLEIAMGWHILNKFDKQLVWHNGGTGGFRTFAGFDLAQKKGVVVLCNTSFDIDEIGRHLIIDQYPVGTLKASVVRSEIKVDEKTLETYTGLYQLSPAFSITVTREGARLFAQATNQPKFELFAEKENEFFLKVVDAQVHFTKDDAGKMGLTLFQNGGAIPGRRVP